MDSQPIIQWLKPWEEARPELQTALEAELRREVVPGHSLHGVSLRAIARRIDNDDALFSIVGSPSVVVVHLSYGKETNPQWPHTQFFASLREWEAQAAD